MRRLALILAGAVLAFVFAFAADAAWLRLRADQNRDAVSTVQVRVLLAIPQKNGRTEYVSGGTEQEPCVRALFPHNGLDPCWYAAKHTRKRIHY